MEFQNELVSKAKADVTELETAVEAAREELDIHLANADIERKEYEKITPYGLNKSTQEHKTLDQILCRKTAEFGPKKFWRLVVT